MLAFTVIVIGFGAVRGAGGDGRVLAVPAAGGRHGQLQCLAIGRTEQASVHHGALSVSLTARPGRFYHGGLVWTLRN